MKKVSIFPDSLNNFSKQSRVDFPQELKVDDFPPTRNVQQNETLERPDEETNTSDTEYTQGDETLDMAILQELIRDEGSL